MTVGIKGKVKCYNSFYATCLYECLNASSTEVRLRVTAMEDAAARLVSFNGTKTETLTSREVEFDPEDAVKKVLTA